MNRENCSMRHENGNCLPCGGFCTAVNDEICHALHNAYYHGANETRDELVLSMVEVNAKYQERTLEILRNIHEKVTGDTVEVVRCRDCTYAESHPTLANVRVCGKFKFGTKRLWMPEDGFCSAGERKAYES